MRTHPFLLPMSSLFNLRVSYTWKSPTTYVGRLPRVPQLPDVLPNHLSSPYALLWKRRIQSLKQATESMYIRCIYPRTLYVSRGEVKKLQRFMRRNKLTTFFSFS